MPVGNGWARPVLRQVGPVLRQTVLSRECSWKGWAHRGDPKSRHFGDQAERYAEGRLREVYFYPHQLQGHVERECQPGG